VQNEDGSWRIRTNHEPSELVENADSEIYKKQKNSLAESRDADGRKGTPKRILEWKPIGRRIRERPRKRWIEDIEEDIQIMGIIGWRKLCKEGTEWKRITHSGL
jgi:hypothetical protein